jgi:predicted ATPase/class 3 adenylate cyclase
LFSQWSSPESYTPRHLAERILMSRAALEGERKQLTVLFADLKGSMELVADRDPEEARRILDPVLELLMDAVHRYDGTVNQVMGDGIMALFGAPIAHEDHAVRACHAALRMQTTVREHAAAIAREHRGATVQIRIGVNSGEVVVRAIGSDLRMDYTAVGQTTHLGARMEQLANPGTILITGETARLAEGHIQATPIGPVVVRGLPAPVEVYQLIEVTATPPRLHAAATRGMSRFVGRAAEIAQLQRSLSRAASGHGQVVAVVGEPGVGKSRLIHEFIHSATLDGWKVLEGHAVSYGRTTSYLPIVHLLKGRFAISERDGPREIREKVTAHITALEPALEAILPALFALLDAPDDDPRWQQLDPAERRHRTLEALEALVVRESQDQPLVLLFEDLHWIDRETQAFLDRVLRRLPETRILLLVSYRPEYAHDWGERSDYTQLRVDLFSPESVSALLGELLGSDRSLDPLKQVLTEKTGGNPLFLEESARTLVETGAVTGERRGYRLVRPVESIQVPATVQAILAARIDRLAPEDKHVLQAASVVGTTVPYPLLEAASDETAETLRYRLSRLQAAEFLYESGVSLDQAYAFKHTLTHDVAYASLLHERRRTLHARIVDALESLGAERSAAQLDRLVHHSLRAEQWEKAFAYCREAAARAFARSAHAEALNRVTQALEALERLGPVPERRTWELELVTQRAAALRALHGYGASAVAEVYDKARELYREAGDTPERFSMEWQQMQFFLVRADLDAAAALAASLVEYAERRQDRVLLVDAQLAMGMAQFHRGEFIVAHGHLARAVALSRPEDDRPQLVTHGQDPSVFALSYLAYTLWFMGRPDEAIARAQAAVEIAQRKAHAFSYVSALTFLARISQCRRDLAKAKLVAGEVIAASRTYGFAYYEAQGLIHLGWARVMADGDEAGCAQMFEGYAALEKTGTVFGLRGALVQIAEACLRVGRVGEARSALEKAQREVSGRTTQYWDAEVARLKAEVAESPDVARQWYQTALETARRQGSRSLELRAALGHARLLRARGRADEGRALLAPVMESFTEGRETVEFREAHELLGG